MSAQPIPMPDQADVLALREIIKSVQFELQSATGNIWEPAKAALPPNLKH